MPTYFHILGCLKPRKFQIALNYFAVHCFSLTMHYVMQHFPYNHWDGYKSKIYSKQFNYDICSADSLALYNVLGEFSETRLCKRHIYIIKMSNTIVWFHPIVVIIYKCDAPEMHLSWYVEMTYHKYILKMKIHRTSNKKAITIEYHQSMPQSHNRHSVGNVLLKKRSCGFPNHFCNIGLANLYVINMVASFILDYVY